MNLKGRKVFKEKANILGPGRHNVHIFQVIETTDRFSDLSGAKEKDPSLYPWIDPTPQLATTYVSKEGVVTSRLNLKGFARETDVDDAKIKSGEIEIHQGYACEMTLDGLVRIESPERTEKCYNMLNSLLNATGAEDGDDMEEALINAIAEKKELSIEVYEEDYDNGKEVITVKKVKNPRKAGYVKAETELVETF